MIEAFRPDALHIATEGPLGWAARRWAIRRGLAFTTSFHTRFPEYLHARTRIPTGLGYAWLRRFHNARLRHAGRHRQPARELGRPRLPQRPRPGPAAWTSPASIPPPAPTEARAAPGLPLRRPPRRRKEPRGLPLASTCPGTKVVVGDGPQRDALARAYPDAQFVGERHGEALARGLCRRRRVRLPLPHRHVRPRPAREPGLRHPHRRPPRDRPGRHPGRRATRRRRPGHRPAGRRAARPLTATAPPAAATRNASPGAPAPRPSSPAWSAAGHSRLATPRTRVRGGSAKP